MLRQVRAAAIVLVVPLLVASCDSGSPERSSLPEYWPTEGWRADAPANHGLDERALQDVAEAARNNAPFLDALLVVRHGYLVYEQYFNGYDAATIHNIASVTKSWTSAAVGVARERDGAPQLDDTLPGLLPAYFQDGQRLDKTGITLRHLLEMRSGIDFSEDALDSGDYGTGEELARSDLAAFGLDRPVAHQPGDAWNYSTLDTQLVSAVVHHATGTSLEELVRESLFEPMGVREYQWFADSAGTTIGGQQLSLTPGDMAKLGLLYLHGGRWDGAQLVPSDWVGLSLKPQGTRAYFPASGQVEEIRWYGLHWWTWGPEWFAGYSAFQAKGYGGQQVLVFPALDLIIVTTANLEGVTPTTAAVQEQVIYQLLLDRVLPAVTDADWKVTD